MIKLIKGDCLEKMKDIESGSVDMILTDPPYGTMKGINKEFSGYGRKNHDGHMWDTTLDTNTMFKECDRILRKNGACALFCQDPYTGELMTNAIPNMPFSYRLTWLKDNFANALLVNKAPVNYTEDICLFFKKENEIKNPAWDYTNKIFHFIGKSRKEIFNDFEKNGFKKFSTLDTFNSRDARRYNFHTEEVYRQLIFLYEINKMPGFLTYDESKKISDDFKKSFPKVFNLPEGQKYKSNVLQYKKDYQGLHPTQKPVALLEDLIKTYTRIGDTVLDFTMGSGSTGVACLNTGRNFIGIEMDDKYFDIASNRINNHTK